MTGCDRGCPGCYAKGIAENPFYARGFPNGFGYTWRPKKLDDPIRTKKPRAVFVVSMGDLFGSIVPDNHIRLVLDAMKKAPWHTYILLTKNPRRMYEILSEVDPQKNWWVGTSVGESESSWTRARHIRMHKWKGWNTFLSVEPLHTFPAMTHPAFDYIDWVIVGMRTKPLTPCDLIEIEAIDHALLREKKTAFYKDSVRECFGRQVLDARQDLPLSFPKLQPKRGNQER